MVSWWWLLAAFFVGSVMGIFIIGIFKGGNTGVEQDEHGRID